MAAYGGCDGSQFSKQITRSEETSLASKLCFHVVMSSHLNHTHIYLGEDAVKALAGDPHGQNPLLPPLASPATAVHHPQEVGLDPGHPRVGEPVSTKPVHGGHRFKIRNQKWHMINCDFPICVLQFL